MQLNNKGFAITGILYTLYVLFLLILVSVLGALRARKRMLEQYTERIEKSYQGKKIQNVSNFNTYKNVEVTGKYKFQMKDNANKTYECSAYLKKGLETIDLTEITYTTKDCNDYKKIAQSITLLEIISFEESD